mmetsp:Transcript_36036/g.84509  ORF Transcript_36036/g.84509 Transcript_36036/m.84509 type:complete len:411 (-) Transcript_36036:354-1586(-)
MSSEQWQWINLASGSEQLVADLCSGEHGDGVGMGRGCVVIQTNATTSFHVIFSHSPELPTRNTDNPVLRFVVGKRQNSATSVGLGNPYIKKEPIDITSTSDALLHPDPEKSRTYWFLYDRTVQIAAMGVHGQPQPDLCRLLTCLQDSHGYRAGACENLRYIAVGCGKMPVSLRVVQILAPPDLSIPRHRFDAVQRQKLPWDGNSIIFELDARHRGLVEQAQRILAASPLAPYYALVDLECVCLNIFQALDPLRRVEMPLTTAAGSLQDMESTDWRQYHQEVHKRAANVLESANWTYFPMKMERVDCTAITLAPTAPGCDAALGDWLKALQQALGLRNAVTRRESLAMTFAFQIFPLEGEKVMQARRDVVRQLSALLEKEWNVMEFRRPQLACWKTHSEYLLYNDYMSQHA